MKLLLMSDNHLGFASRTEREQDAFLAFEEGIRAGLSCDAILLGGDIFDTRIPTAEAFSSAMEILLLPLSSQSEVKVTGIKGKELKSKPGIHVIAINGNHERRVRGLVNPVQALEKGGFLTRLHCNGVLLEKGQQEKVAVQAMSAVPEQYAETALKEWDPKPIPGCYNILMFHQNLEGFVRSETTIPKEALPEGFDLYLCGDIHERHSSTLHGKPLLLPGSTVATQINKDSCEPRSYTLLDTQANTQESIPFKSQRSVHYIECQTKEEVEQALAKALHEKQSLKPIIKVKSPVPRDELQARFGNQAMLMVAQEKELPSLTIEEQKVSVQQQGREILEKNLKSLGLDPRLFEQVFELLLEKKQEEALTLLKEKN